MTGTEGGCGCGPTVVRVWAGQSSCCDGPVFVSDRSGTTTAAARAESGARDDAPNGSGPDVGGRSRPRKSPGPTADPPPAQAPHEPPPTSRQPGGPEGRLPGARHPHPLVVAPRARRNRTRRRPHRPALIRATVATPASGSASPSAVVSGLRLFRRVGVPSTASASASAAAHPRRSRRRSRRRGRCRTARRRPGRCRCDGRCSRRRHRSRRHRHRCTAGTLIAGMPAKIGMWQSSSAAQSASARQARAQRLEPRSASRRPGRRRRECRSRWRGLGGTPRRAAMASLGKQ